MFETTYSPGDLTAVAYRDGSETGRMSLVSASGRGAARRAGRPPTRSTPTDRDLAYVEIALVDGDGNVHFGEDRAVTVAVDGPAVLQGFGSGNPCTEETFGAPTHDTFNGRALAVIRPTGAGHDHRHRVDEGLRRPHRHHRGRAPVTWELRWHPFRGEWVLFTAHRGARPWIGETVADDEPAVPDDNALAPLGKRIDTTNPDYRGRVRVHQRPPGVLARRARADRRRRPVPHPARASAPRRWSATTTTRRSRWPTSTDDEVAAVVRDVAGPHRRVAGASTASRTC